MTKQPFDTPDGPDPLTNAEDVNAFMLSDIGIQYMTAMQGKYDALHHKAEIENMTAEQKAFYIERAAGLRIAMEWFTSRKLAFEQGRYDKNK